MTAHAPLTANSDEGTLPAGARRTSTSEKSGLRSTSTNSPPSVTRTRSALAPGAGGSGCANAGAASTVAMAASVLMCGLTFELTPTAEAGAVSPVRDDANAGTDRAYSACRSGSGVERGVRPRWLSAETLAEASIALPRPHSAMNLPRCRTKLATSLKREAQVTETMAKAPGWDPVTQVPRKAVRRAGSPSRTRAAWSSAPERAGSGTGRRLPRGLVPGADARHGRQRQRGLSEAA